MGLRRSFGFNHWYFWDILLPLRRALAGLSAGSVRLCPLCGIELTENQLSHIFAVQHDEFS